MKAKSRIGVALLALLTFASSGCKPIEDDVEPPEEALEGVPIVPLSIVEQEGGTADVAQTILYTPFAIDSTAAWYRRNLIEHDWELISDVRTPDGRTTLHAVRDGPPLWVILETFGPDEGTRYTIMGAMPNREDLNDARERTGEN